MDTRLIDTNGIRLHAAIQGKGPPVLLLHGYPGLAYSWRHQMAPLAEAGYRAIALDLRGFGRSDRPADPALYDANYIQADILGVLDALGEKRAFIVGQDFGAQFTWNLAMRAPERVIGIVAMVPYDFDLAGRQGAGIGSLDPGASPAQKLAATRPTIRFAEAAKNHFVHFHYFQMVGPAERELGADPRLFLRKLFYALSGEGDLFAFKQHPAEGRGYMDVLPPAPPLPWRWMSEAEFDHYAAEYTRLGPDLAFIGGLNFYRAADRNWEISAPYADRTIQTPSLFLIGVEDPVNKYLTDDALDIQRRRVPGLRGEVFIPGAGHFVQQERPAETTAAILKFLNEVRREAGL